MLSLRRVIALLLLCLTPLAARAAEGAFVWARSMDGTDEGGGTAIALDGAGNIYITGGFTGTADFDPGAGTFNLTSAGQNDIFVQKLDASGNLLWARRMGGTSYDIGRDIVVDGSGNVYTTGLFQASADFDPGAEAYNLTSAGYSDIFVQKLDISGNLVWARRMGGVNNDVGWAIALDGEGNLHNTGSFKGTVDFDPGAETYNLTSAGSSDIFVQKLDASGNLALARGMGGIGIDSGHDLAVDSAGNVYTTGYFAGTVDFDPGARSFNLTSAGLNSFFVQKLNASGNLVWARHVDGTINSIGIAVDSVGNVYTKGPFQGTADFDPGAGTVNLTSAGNYDIFVQKLAACGNFVWARRMGGRNIDGGSAIAVDGMGNVYTTGYFDLMVDFDPGADTVNLTSAGSYDIFVQKMDASGNFGWARGMGGTSSDGGSAIAVDSAGDVYTTGSFMGTADFDPGAGTVNLTSAGNTDIFVQKLSGPDRTPPNAISITPATTGPTNATSVDFTVTFDEEVQHFDAAADVVLVHSGTASTGANISAGLSVYSVTVTGITGDGSFTLAVNTASDVQDLAGNPLATSVTSAAVVIDNTAPTVSIGAPSTSLVSSIGAATYPVAVDGASSINLTSGDATINHSGTAGGSVNIVNGTTANPTVQITGVIGDGSYTISIAAGIATDAAANISLAVGPSVGAVTADNTPPTVSIGAPSGSPVSSNGTATYPVAVVGASSINLTSSDLILNHSGTAGGSVVIADGASENPTVQVSGVTGDGSYTISIAAGIATDAVGNVSLGAGPSSGAVSVDNTAPGFFNVVANPSEASEGDTVSISFESSEPIAGDPDVTVNGNPATRTAKAAFTYEYTVLPGDALAAATIEISAVDGVGNTGTLSDATALAIVDAEGEGAVEGAVEGAIDGEGEGSIEGEGEGEEPPVGCGGCNAGGGPMEKSLGDWLAAFLGLAVLLGAHLSLRVRQEA